MHFIEKLVFIVLLKTFFFRLALINSKIDNYNPKFTLKMTIPNSSSRLCKKKHLTNSKFLLFLVLLILTSYSYSQQLAFPEAEGHGKYAVGGRGGDVYKVTNLNNNGPGSLREAIDASGPRTVIFEVSGTINLVGSLKINNPYITIAGQTAPGDGICLANSGFTIAASHVIIKHLRFRLGDNGHSINGNNYPDADTITINPNGGTISDIIVDHCSVSWSIDEALSMFNDGGTTSNVTWSNLIVSHPLSESHHSKGEHSKSVLFNYNSRKVSFIKNYVTGGKERHVRMNEGVTAEIHNNIFYGFHDASAINVGVKLDAENNAWYESGYELAAYSNAILKQIGTGYTTESYNYTAADNRLHHSGNVTNSTYPPNQLTPAIASGWTNNSTRGLDSGYNTLSINAAEAHIIENAGATLPRRDSYDTKLISDYQNNVPAFLIDTQLEVGGYPVLNSEAAPTDTDNDGMPDAWETERGLNPNNPDDRNVVNTNGYTNLEFYINNIDASTGTAVSVTGVSVSPDTATINIPETVTLTKTIEPADATNQSGVWSSSNTNIATVNANGLVTPVSAGEVVITFNSNDGGFSDFGTITVTDTPISVESVSLSPETLELNINITETLSALIVPSNATDQTGVWTSSDTNIATIDQQGLIQPVAAGVVTISFTTNDGGFVASSVVNINDNLFGQYEFFNADTDNSIQMVQGGEVLDLNVVGDNLNFRAIPYGGDGNFSVESIGFEWSGVEIGSHAESSPLYAGLTGHFGNDYSPYAVQEGTYNFTINYFSQNQLNGDLVARDTFSITFVRGSVVNAGNDVAICQGDTTSLTATGANSYLWNTGETTATIAVTPDTTTTYTVTGSHTNGSASTTDSVTVTVNELPTVSAGQDQTICSGESVTLTANASVGDIVWSNGSSATSITVSPSETFTYTVTANNNGCITTDEVTVNVNAAPNANAGNDVDIVNGNSVTLTASGGGTYLWSTGETTQNITVSPTVDTVYTVTVTNGNGCSADDNVLVNIIEPIVANAGDDVAICEGESVTLAANGGDTYLWSTGETTQSITVSPENTTVYSVEVSDAYSSDTDDVTVIVNPIPVVSAGNDVTINQGESVTLYASGGNTYLWSTGETNANISVSPTETTTYSVTTTINGCSDTDEVTVTVITLVQASAGDDQTICNGVEAILTASGGDTYEWSTGETTQSITVQPGSTTTYSVTVTNAYGSDTDDVIVSVEQCGALDFEYKAFPNPTKGNLNLKISGLDKDAIIRITDIMGNTLNTIQVVANGGQTTRLRVNLRGRSQGFYFVTLYTDNRTVTRKIILN